MRHTIFEEAKKRTFKRMMQEMSDHYEKTGEIVAPSVTGSDITDEAIEMCKNIPFTRRSDYGKKRGEKND